MIMIISKFMMVIARTVKFMVIRMMAIMKGNIKQMEKVLRQKRN